MFVALLKKEMITWRSFFQSLLTCLLAPNFTIAIIIFSDAMKGSSCLICFSITFKACYCNQVDCALETMVHYILLTFEYTTNPSAIFCNVLRMASAVKKASAMLILLLALSSKDLSSHCTAAVCCASATNTIKCRARLQHLQKNLSSLLVGKTRCKSIIKIKWQPCFQVLVWLSELHHNVAIFFTPCSMYADSQ